ncbi:hydrolase [Naumannella sp. ID2617S]|nr:hydrolase [Naumannella sp. ID2617S]
MYADLPAASPRAVLLLGHGAGGGVDAPDLEALRALAETGIAVLRYEQPWRTAGKKIAPAPARLDEGWAAALAYAGDRFAGVPLIVGGRSAGARVAVRCAAVRPVAGVVALSFPLHPPGRPEKSRAPELLGADAPVLVLQGARDPFGTPGEVREAVVGSGRIEVVEVPDCAHELKPPARAASTPESIAALLRERVRAFVGGP